MDIRGIGLLLACLAASGFGAGLRRPMQANAEDSAMQRWLGKKVLASKLLDNMESLERWKMAFWAQGKGGIALTRERATDGTQSLRFRSHTLAIRTHNLQMDGDRRTVEVGPGGPATLKWEGRVTSLNAPWVAVIVPEEHPHARVEAIGRLQLMPGQKGKAQ